MLMNPSLRKLMLTAHIVSSVGWLGAVAGFLALAIAALYDQNVLVVRAAYFSMELVGWYVIVPLCLASLLTGLIQSFGTKWGLFRHYWISAKFVITLLSALILFAFTHRLLLIRTDARGCDDAHVRQSRKRNRAFARLKRAVHHADRNLLVDSGEKAVGL